MVVGKFLCMCGGKDCWQCSFFPPIPPSPSPRFTNYESLPSGQAFVTQHIFGAKQGERFKLCMQGMYMQCFVTSYI